MLIDQREQTHVVEPAGDAAPLDLCDRHQKRGRLGNIGRALEFGLGRQRALSGIAAQEF